MIVRTLLDGFLNEVYRSTGGLWFPSFDIFVSHDDNVLAVLGKPEGKILIPGNNIVTSAGDIFYAQRSAVESPTDTFTLWELGSAGTPGKAANRSSFTPIGSTQKAQDAGYPKSNDDDTDNTDRSADRRTTRVSYTAGDFNHAAITHGWVTNTTPGASEPILAGWAWASSINKTASDTLKGILNHRFLGV